MKLSPKQVAALVKFAYEHIDFNHRDLHLKMHAKPLKVMYFNQTIVEHFKHHPYDLNLDKFNHNQFTSHQMSETYLGSVELSKIALESLKLLRKTEFKKWASGLTKILKKLDITEEQDYEVVKSNIHFRKLEEHFLNTSNSELNVVFNPLLKFCAEIYMNIRNKKLQKQALDEMVLWIADDICHRAKRNKHMKDIEAIMYVMKHIVWNQCHQKHALQSPGLNRKKQYTKVRDKIHDDLFTPREKTLLVSYPSKSRHSSSSKASISSSQSASFSSESTKSNTHSEASFLDPQSTDFSAESTHSSAHSKTSILSSQSPGFSSESTKSSSQSSDHSSLLSLSKSFESLRVRKNRR